MTFNRLAASKRLHSLFYLRLQAVAVQKCNASLFPNKYNLPSLPVPILNTTLQKYLKSVEPFLSITELEKTKTILRNFEENHGPVLQQYLEKRASIHENWLSEWWDNIAYLEYRDPVVIFSSPGLLFPQQKFLSQNDQINYASNIILGALDYKLLIDKDGIPKEKMGNSILDMNQYKKVYGTCRIPQFGRDLLEFNPKSNHIIVARNNHFFRVEILSNGQVLSCSQLTHILENIYKQSENAGPPVGILTSTDRDSWSKAYLELSKDENNKTCLNEIAKSLFLVCLDNYAEGTHENSLSNVGAQCIHGGGSNQNSANRWFDKTLQFIVGANGGVGLTYEHSPSEGQPIAVLTDYLIKYIEDGLPQQIPYSNSTFDVRRLDFKLTDSAKYAIKEAQIKIDKLVNNLDLNIFQFSDFGKDFIKSHKLSPDSFIQIAMQYAFYRNYKVPGAHYESASTRMYIHGRTETIRSCSVESILFAKIMLDNTANDQEKLNAMKTAINAHKNYTIEAINGLGVDRHLLGLKMAAKDLSIDVGELFTDPSYLRSTHMRLSTSQVATKCNGVMTYGPLVADGYGCCYNPRDNDINFAISCFKDNLETDVNKFRTSLESSLKEMHNILVKTIKSKL